MQSTPSASAQGPVREPGPEIAPPPGRDRDGRSILERKAVYRVQLEIAAMPASLVVQILLWPEKLTDWARDEGVTPALVYNMLGGFKPYHGLRLRLAERLGVTKSAIDHLIDGVRSQPTSRQIPDPPADLSVERKPVIERPPVGDARVQDASAPEGPGDSTPSSGAQLDMEL